MTQEEIEELKGVLEYDLKVCDDPETARLIKIELAVIDRLAKLEEAVAFKGFDEVPEKSCRIQLLSTGAPPAWKIRGVWFDKENNNIVLDGIDTRWHLTWNELHKHCDGWRCPVGDLSE